MTTPSEKRRFGRTDMDVSPLGLGGAEIGFEGASPATVDRLLAAALDAGINVVDTAECSVDGEEKLGAALRGRRDRLWLRHRAALHGLPAGVHVAIVGTTRPKRFRANVEALARGPLPAAEIEAIRARWRAVADASWTGEI